MIGIPPACVVLGKSNEVVDDGPEDPLDDPDGADALVEPDVTDGPRILPVDPGAGVLPAFDLMEAVAFLDIAGADEVDSPDWECEDMVVLPVPEPEPPREPDAALESDERDRPVLCGILLDLGLLLGTDREPLPERTGNPLCADWRLVSLNLLLREAVPEPVRRDCNGLRVKAVLLSDSSLPERLDTWAAE